MAIWTRNVSESLCGSYCGYAKNAARSIRRAQGLIGYRRRGGVLKRRHSRPLPESALPFLTSRPCSATSSPGLSPCLLSLMTDSANLPCPGRQGLRHAVFRCARIIWFARVLMSFQSSWPMPSSAQPACASTLLYPIPHF